MMRICLYAVAVMSIVFTYSCKNSDSPVTISSNEKESYYPISTGSVWNYTGDYGNYTVTVVGDSTFNNKVYKKKRYVYDTDIEYGISRRENLSILSPITDENHEIRDILVLRDDLKIDEEWDYKSISSGGVPTPVWYKHYVEDTNATRMVLGKEYTNVLKIYTESYVNFTGSYELAITFVSYYAKGIGLIEEIVYRSTGTKYIRLVSSDIK